MTEKIATIVPDNDGVLELYTVLTYKGKIYSMKVRFEHELEKDGEEEFAKHFRVQGNGLLSAAERTLKEIRK